MICRYNTAFKVKAKDDPRNLTQQILQHPLLWRKQEIITFNSLLINIVPQNMWIGAYNYKRESTIQKIYIFMIVSIVNRQHLRGWKRRQKVGQEVFLAAWCHKYLLHSQQYLTAALPAMSQVTPCTLHSFLITVYTYSQSLSLHAHKQKGNHILSSLLSTYCMRCTTSPISASVTVMVPLTLCFT